MYFDAHPKFTTFTHMLFLKWTSTLIISMHHLLLVKLEAVGRNCNEWISLMFVTKLNVTSYNSMPVWPKNSYGDTYLQVGTDQRAIDSATSQYEFLYDEMANNDFLCNLLYKCCSYYHMQYYSNTD